MEAALKKRGYNTTVFTYMLNSGLSTHSSNRNTTKTLGIDGVAVNACSRKKCVLENT